MTRADLINQWILVERRGWDFEPNRFFGICEWASEDLLNFRIAGIGHIGITKTNGTVTLHVPTND